MLSFVIPAFNEQEHILRCVSSIVQWAPADREIIVVDNGSRDATARIAEEAGARVVHSRARTIGAVRNEGVAVARGDILVFIDADCALTEAWRDGVAPALEALRAGRFGCAGSQVVPPANESNFLWRHWFTPFVNQASASHLGSAHLMCTRTLFDQIGGFDEALATGEDYDFCARVRGRGQRLLNQPDLRVEHYGFPRNWSEFWGRERWHGRGDAHSIMAFARSRIALASVAFCGTVIAALLALVLGQFALAGGLALGAAVILFGTAAAKFGHAGPRTVLAAAAILVVYFAARATAVVDGVLRHPAARLRA